MCFWIVKLEILWNINKLSVAIMIILAAMLILYSTGIVIIIIEDINNSVSNAI